MSEALNILNELCGVLAESLKNELSIQGHTSSGDLAKSIKVALRQKASGFEINGNAVYYAKYVNEGRKPGAKGIPIDNLLEWIRQRKIQIEGMKERQIAFMFQTSIKKKGIPGSFFINKTLDSQENNINQSVSAACGSLVDIYIDQMFNVLAK